MTSRIVFAAVTLLVTVALSAQAQHPAGQQGSSNITIVSHLPLAGAEKLLPGSTNAPANPNAAAAVRNPLINEALQELGTRTADITMEQELSRPYVYICHRFAPTGFWIVSIKDPGKPVIIYDWKIENAELGRGSGALGPMYAKSKGRYYFMQSFQFGEGGPHRDLGAIVFDVTGLPDTTKIKEVARINDADHPGGFHENFSYKHSSGATLMFTDVTGAPMSQDRKSVV